MLNHQNSRKHNDYNQMYIQEGLIKSKLWSWLIGHGVLEAKE